ncbi:MAG: SMP-30/gluconolactonase/LRE family protein [Actinobacteria bacterium]|nr:SMP-30/gluconolactonase/LRE family protein [Actinomycetota bacterium]
MTQTETLATGLCFGEGPRWHNGQLWFSDMHDFAVKTVDLRGRVDRKVEVPGRPSGLGWLPDGTLLVVSMTDRQVLRLEHDRLVVHADLGAVTTFHCNDMVVDADGRAYVGNFGFDLHAAERTGDWSIAAPASMALVQRDGSVSVAAADLAFPNGTVITPDGSTLIVAESMGNQLTAFDRASDGTLSNRRTWARLPGRLPDGICLDAAGAVWVANAGAPECLRVAEGGQVLEVIDTGDRCYACMLGGPEGTTLFMLTSETSDPETSRDARSGRVQITTVSTPRAGLP